MKTPRSFLLLLAAILAAGPALRAADAPPAVPPVVPPAVILAAPQSDEVVNPLDCEHLLAVATRDLNQASPEMDAKLQAFTNPFYPKLPPPAPDIVGTPTNETAPVTQPKLSDSDKLAQVVDALKASGTMGMNGVLILVMENHPPLHAGDVIEVTFPDDNAPSRITILSISEKSYTLKLNDTVLPVSLKSTASSSTPPKL